MEKSEYITEIKTRLTRMFKASKKGYKIPDIERHRLEGFIQAGVFLRIATLNEMGALLEDVTYALPISICASK